MTRLCGRTGTPVNRLLTAAIAVATTALLASGCSKPAQHETSPPAPNPNIVAGKPVSSEVPSGLRPNPPAGRQPIINGDNSNDMDRLAGYAIADVEQFWAGAYGKPLDGKFTPVNGIFSWDERFKHGKFCDSDTYEFWNAEWCGEEPGSESCPTDGSACSPAMNTIGWDRGVLLPDVHAIGGDMGVAMVLAHEYGHAIQSSVMSGLIPAYTVKTALAAEQQADCFAGVYMRWVVNDKSQRFTLNNGDGLTKVMLSIFLVRDPLLTETLRAEHGSAFERVTAFQNGFDDGAAACAKITPDEVEQRRAKYPKDLLEQGKTGEAPITEKTVSDLVEALTKVVSPAKPPTVTFDNQPCPDAKPSPPASYCPSSNTISVDLDKLIVMGTRLSRGSPLGKRAPAPFGDYTAFSAVVSRYMLAVQNQKGGLSLDNTNAGLRTACLTGVATTKLAPGVDVSDGFTVKLTGGDLDEAVAGVLSNGLVASNVKGDFAPSGFARNDAFRTGVLSDADTCYKRWS
jgi:hypothetical protein